MVTIRGIRTKNPEYSFLNMKSKYLYIVAISMLLMASCANRGQGPQGGPRDTIPPKVLKESPLNGVLAYQGKKIEVTFDEQTKTEEGVFVFWEKEI